MAIPKEKLCNRCKKIKNSDEFYRRRVGADLSPYCKVCTNRQTIDRQREFKRKCVEYKGGKCQICGYNKCNGALEFHHISSSLKEFQVSKNGLKKFDDSIKCEIDKCMILCSNCHKELHWGFLKEKMTESGKDNG